MKKVLIGAFYALQGLGNLVIGLFFTSGGLGGGGFFVEILIKNFLLLASCLSVFTALTLFLKREKWAQEFGRASSFLFGSFYAWMALGSLSVIAPQYYIEVAILLLLSTLIVALNIVSVFFLHACVRNK